MAGIGKPFCWTICKKAAARFPPLLSIDDDELRIKSSIIDRLTAHGDARLFEMIPLWRLSWVAVAGEYYLKWLVSS